MSPPARTTADAWNTCRILWARGLRAFGDGFAVILLPLCRSSLLALGPGVLGHRVRWRPPTRWGSSSPAGGRPLILAGRLKITYDLPLLRAFAAMRPPEDEADTAPKAELRDAGSG